MANAARVTYPAALQRCKLDAPLLAAGLLTVAGTAVNYFVGIRCNKWDMKNRHKWWDLDNKMSYLAGELSSYEASKDVHLYWMPPWLGEKYQKELNQRIHHTVRQQLNYYLEGIVGWLTQNIWEGVSYLYLIWLVCEGRLDAAEFVLYFGMITGFAQWCRSIVSGMRELHKEAQFVEEERRFFQKLIQGGDGGQEREELSLEEGHIPEISFVGVSFQYPGAEEPTIQDLNLTLKPGENIALVGLNGAGKTTFIKLLCGFYDPTQGEILIDGVNRNHYKPESWLRYNGSGKTTFIKLLCRLYDPQEGEILLNGVNIRQYRYGEYLGFFSTVFQDYQIFAFLLGENVAAESDYDKAKVVKALEDAGFGDRLKTLEKGIDTQLYKFFSEEGVELSGGESQKVAIARCLYKDAPYVILDEPTAALDPVAEADIYLRMSRFTQHKGAIYISHRLSSCHFCDRILVFESGRIEEQGSHSELLAARGLYRKLWDAQARYYT